MSAAVIREILELARWAPSGDNAQAWRFEIAGADHLVVHCYDTREYCVYDLLGHLSQISYGALLETIAIAASAHGLRADVMRRAASADDKPEFDVRFVADPAIAPSPLISAIRRRSVQRRPMRTRALTAQQKQALEAAAGTAYQVQWIEGFGPKLRAARLMFDNAKLRLTMPEAYETQRRVIEWGVARSVDRVPDQALGADAATLRLMKWAMVSWDRLSTVNLLMGTWAPRLQIDLIPGIACGAHFVIKARQQPATIDDYVAAGRAAQRFWLTLTVLGLQMQPEMAPLIFSAYARNGVRFSRLDKLRASAGKLQGKLSDLIGADAAFAVFMGRVGSGQAPRARSIRKPLADLMQEPGR